MLKVKQNIDLKELEKYGFKNVKEYDRFEKQYYEVYEYKINESEYIVIFADTRNIRLLIEDEYYNQYTGEKTFDLLYDLIKDGLVIKGGTI